LQRLTITTFFLQQRAIDFSFSKVPVFLALNPKNITMKKSLLFIFLVVASFSFLTAQSTLTSDSFNFQAGDSIHTVLFSDSVTSPGPAGANQTWDFSFLQERDRSTATIKAASTSPYANLFPNADIAGLEFSVRLDSANVDQFFSNDPNEFVHWGQSVQVTNAGMTSVQNIAFSDPEVILTYPMMFMDSVADDFYGEYESSPGFSMVRKGSNYRLYDGHGTLMMPNGAVYADVIRIKLVQIYKDSSLNPTFPFSIDYESENVYYFSQGGKLPHLQYNKFTSTSAPNPPQTIHFIKAYSGNGTVGIKDLLAPDVLTLAPNPSKGLAELSIKSTGVENLQVSIITLAGQVVATPFEGQSLATATLIPLQTSHLAKGFYIVKVALGTKIGFVKMQVE